MILLEQFDSPLGVISVAECKGRALALTYGPLTSLLELFPQLTSGCAQAGTKGQLSQNAVVARAVSAYLAGETMRLKVVADLSYIKKDFDREVLKALFRRKKTQPLSYAELAALAGHAGAARAVGSALSRNPLPIIIPCHRVILSDGTRGNYSGGQAKKEWLLQRDAVAS